MDDLRLATPQDPLPAGREYSAIGFCLALRALLLSVSDLPPGLLFAWLGLKPGG
jgi:hypothetical protein